MKLKDQVAIVTGAARGNGFAAAKALASEGANVVLIDICADMESVPYPLATQDDLDAAVKEIAAMGVKAVGIKCDIRSADEVSAMVDKVLADFGKIDILVNNAGATWGAPAEDHPLERVAGHAPQADEVRGRAVPVVVEPTRDGEHGDAHVREPRLVRDPAPVGVEGRMGRPVVPVRVRLAAEA